MCHWETLFNSCCITASRPALNDQTCCSLPPHGAPTHCWQVTGRLTMQRTVLVLRLCTTENQLSAIMSSNANVKSHSDTAGNHCWWQDVIVIAVLLWSHSQCTFVCVNSNHFLMPPNEKFSCQNHPANEPLWHLQHDLEPMGIQPTRTLINQDALLLHQGFHIVKIKSC